MAWWCCNLLGVIWVGWFKYNYVEQLVGMSIENNFSLIQMVEERRKQVSKIQRPQNNAKFECLMLTTLLRMKTTTLLMPANKNHSKNI